MEKSESIKELAGALHEFQKTVGKVTKDATNPFFKSKYASLESVIETALPALGGLGLSYAQFPDGDGIYTLIMHTSGEWIGAHAALELKGHTPQDQGSAITYMRRYALSAALGLATEDDDDGNAASKPAAKTTTKPVKPNVVVAAEARDKAERKEIQELCDKKSEAPLLSKPDYQKFILERTGLVLGEAKNAEIIERLKAN